MRELRQSAHQGLEWQYQEGSEGCDCGRETSSPEAQILGLSAWPWQAASLSSLSSPSCKGKRELRHPSLKVFGVSKYKADTAGVMYVPAAPCAPWAAAAELLRHGVLQSKNSGWVPISFSGIFPRPRDRNPGLSCLCIGRQILLPCHLYRV